jgi:hypothetical protein
MGEEVKSLRTCLRRACHTSYILTGTTDTTSLVREFKSIFRRFPLPMGYDPNGINSAKGTLVPGSNFPFNFVFVTPYNWLQFCFVGQRGSAIWHANVESIKPVTRIQVMRSNDTLSAGNYYTSRTLATGATNNSAAAFGLSASVEGNYGMSITNQYTQAGISVLAPMYSPLRMQSPDPNKSVLGSSVDQTTDDAMNLIFALMPSSDAATVYASTHVKMMFSVGTDFNFIFFQNIPTLTYLSSYPASNG